MKPNELPPHIKKYFLDYVDIYEVMKAFHGATKEIGEIRDQQMRDKLFFDMKLNQAITALREIRTLGAIENGLNVEAQIADEALKKIELE